MTGAGNDERVACNIRYDGNHFGWFKRFTEMLTFAA